MAKQHNVTTQSGEVIPVDIALRVDVIYKPAQQSIFRVQVLYDENNVTGLPANFAMAKFPETVDPNVGVEAGDAYFQSAIDHFTGLGYDEGEIEKIVEARAEYAYNWNPPQ